MPDTDRVSGKQSYFTFNGTSVPITKVDPSVVRKLGDTTDSGDYNGTQDMLPTTQIPVGYTVEASVEGRFRKSVTPGFLNLAFSSATQIPVVLGIDQSPTIWGHGVCDISNFRSSIPVDDIVSFSCDIKSWGSFTPNG